MGDRLGGGAIVSGQHPDLETESLQLLHRDLRFGAQRIGDRDEANRLIADSHEHPRSAGRSQRSGALTKPVQFDAVASQQRLVAEKDLAAVDARLNALALERASTAARSFSATSRCW